MTRLASLVLAVTLAGTACSSGPRDVKYGDVMDVVLVSSGDDTVDLRYDLNEGDVFRQEMVMETTQQVTLDGEEAGGAPTAPIRMVMRVEVVEVTEEGYRLRWEFLSVDVEGAAGDQADAMLQGLAGVTIETTMTDRGLVTDARVSGTGDLPEALSQIMEQMTAQARTMSMPLPDEPVGVGATWKGGVELDIFGMKMRATYDFEVVEIDGSLVTVDVTALQESVPGPAEVPGIPASASLEVEEGTITARGEMVFDLNSPVPDSASVRSDGSMAMTASEGEETHRLEIDIDLDQEMRRLK